jgi:hypothetical protein
MAKEKKSSNPPISETLEKALLTDIEQKGLPFDQISLVQLCDKRQLIYGEPSTTLRRAIQKHYTKLKNRTPRNYQKLLLKYSIVPGPFTFHRLKETESPIKSQEPTIDKTNEIIDGDSIGETSNIDEPSIESASESSFIEDSFADIARSFETLSIQASPALQRKSMMTTPNQTPNQTPNRKQAPSIAASFASPNQTPNRKQAPPFASGFASPIPSLLLDDTTRSFVGEEAHEDIAYSILDYKSQLGTSDKPFIIMANPDLPEQNGPVLEISRLKDVACNHYEHQGYHIRLSVDLPDFDGWEGFIPNPNEYPLLLPLFGRIVMFKAPSRAFWLRSHERYHEDKRKIDCVSTQKVHEKTDTAIEADLSRQFHHHLVVFAPGTVLDNSIFSNNNTHVKRHQLSMKLDVQDNDFGKLIYGMGLWWRISEAGGTRIRNASTKVDASTLLD